MEVYFEHKVESEDVSNHQFNTVADAVESAQEEFQKLCEKGDYEYGRGDVVILAFNVENGEFVLSGEKKVYSEKPMKFEKPYLQCEFI